MNLPPNVCRTSRCKNQIWAFYDLARENVQNYRLKVILLDPYLGNTCSRIKPVLFSLLCISRVSPVGWGPFSPVGPRVPRLSSFYLN